MRDTRLTASGARLPCPGAWRFRSSWPWRPRGSRPTPSRSSARSAERSPIPRAELVAGATVLITDEATGVPRTVETDAEGRYEATNLRPGTYRVEVVTTSFKKFEQTGVVLRDRRGTARATSSSSSGAVTETVTVSAEAQNNIVAREPGRAPWRSTSSSCATCRATAATCSPSCC